MMSRLVSCVVASLLASGAAKAETTSYDGVYKGEPTSGSRCAAFRPIVRVVHGQATMRYDPLTTFQGSVSADGKLAAHAGRSDLTGKFESGKFAGYARAGRCQYPLALTR